MKLIRDGKIAKDEWSYEIESPKLPLKKPTIVDYEVWESTKGELLKQDVQIGVKLKAVSYTHLRAHETLRYIV